MKLTYEIALQEVEALSTRGMRTDLETMRSALNLLGNPHLKIKTIHVAGTNGKGSTCAFLSSILIEAGYQVGLTTSPHLMDVRERLQLNNHLISKEDFTTVHFYLKEKVGSLNCTYFEWLILMAFEFFSRKKVDFAVIETGLGGRWDATNVVLPVVTAITNVSLDHEAILGPTTELILKEKAEIIKPGAPVISGVTEPKHRQIIEKKALEVGVLPEFTADRLIKHNDNVFSYGPLNKLECSLEGEMQVQNASAAVALALRIKDAGFPISEEAIRSGLKKAAWPGRLEWIFSEPKVLLECAHNREGIHQLVSYLKKKNLKPHFLFGCLKDRPFAEMRDALKTVASSITLAAFENERSFTEEELKILGSEEVLKVNESHWKKWIKKFPKDSVVVVTGSIYLVGIIRKYIKN